MLATAGRPVGGLEDWTVEAKLDGWRATVGISSGRQVVRTRRGRDVTDHLPELAALAHLGVDVVLDGEIIVGGGRPAEFYALAGAMSTRRRRLPLTFVAFDVLAVDGVDVCAHPHHERRRLLDRLADITDGTMVVVPSLPGTDLDLVLASCQHLELEGVVVKRRTGTYRPGARSTDWRKLKTPAWAEHRARRIPPRAAKHFAMT